MLRRAVRTAGDKCLAFSLVRQRAIASEQRIVTAVAVRIAMQICGAHDADQFLGGQLDAVCVVPREQFRFAFFRAQS